MGIARLISRRGKSPLSGRITRPIGGATEEELLQSVLNWNQQGITESMVKKVSTGKSILLARAPHHGGVWERLVRCLNLPSMRYLATDVWQTKS